jgi:hypothetical protein
MRDSVLVFEQHCRPTCDAVVGSLLSGVDISCTLVCLRRLLRP